MVRARLGSAGALAAVLVWLTMPVRAAGTDVSFRDEDGRVVSARLFEARRRPAPAVVLVPMLGRPKEDWQSLAQQLSEADITALAIDLPGSVLPSDVRALERWYLPVRAAVVYLAGHPGVRTGGLGILGASLGASLAAVAAARDPRVRSLALVSPSTDYRGFRMDGPLRLYGGRPALLVASTRDPYAARSVRELAESAPGSREMLWSEEAAHGMLLLARDPEVRRGLVAWFQRTLALH